MASILSVLASGNRTLSYLLGIGVLGLAVAVSATALPPARLGEAALAMFGPSFVLLGGSLVAVFAACLLRLRRLPYPDPRRAAWHEAGLQAAGGLSTLALTYTLFGISLGIGTLAEQELTPATAQEVIRGLTHHFGIAFMTTVVGLPLSALMRAVLLVREAAAAPRTPAPTLERD